MPADVAAVMRLLGQANTGLRVATGGLGLLTAVQRAANGDTAAQEYLRQEGVHEAAELLMPGAGQLTRSVRQQWRDFNAARGPIEGQWREIAGDRPYSAFVRRARKQRWGGHVLIGQPGSGKTTTASRLVSVWHRYNHFPIECVNTYPEDLPEGAATIGIDTLVNRMKRLAACLKAIQVDDDPEAKDESDEDAVLELEDLVASIGGRNLLIDEASLGLGNSAADPGRRAALQSLAQCRHLDWNVCYIGQWAGQLPLPLFGLTTVWVKQPTGDEEDTDRDNPIVRKLWREATSGFSTIAESPWWEEYPDYRSWSFVNAPAGVGGASQAFRGMVPVHRE